MLRLNVLNESATIFFTDSIKVKVMMDVLGTGWRFSCPLTFRLLVVKGLKTSGGTSKPGGHGREKLLFKYLPSIASSTNLPIETNIISAKTKHSFSANSSFVSPLPGFDLTVSHRGTIQGQCPLV